MNVLVPWRPGQHWTRSGLADTEWQDAQDVAAEAAAEDKFLDSKPARSGTVPLATMQAGKPPDSIGLIRDGVEEDTETQAIRKRELAIRTALDEVETRAERDEHARLQRGGRPMRTDSASPANIAAWKYLRKRAKIAGLPTAKLEQFGRDTDGVAGDKEGLIATLLTTEMSTEQWSQRLADDKLTDAERSELMSLNQSGDVDRVLVRAPHYIYISHTVQHIMLLQFAYLVVTFGRAE